MKAFQLIIGLMTFLTFATNAQTRYCDLSIAVAEPTDNYVLPFGDTLDIIINIKNNGPDTVLRTDTIKYTIVGFPGLSYVTDTLLAPGDSLLLQVLSGWADAGQSEDDTATLCLNLVPATTFTDTVPLNDATCVTTIFKGDNSTGIETPKSEVRFLAYPNPVTDLLTVANLDGALSIAMTDMMGRQLLKQQVDVSKAQLDLSRFAAGIYTLNVLYKNGHSSNFKIVKK